MEENRDLVDISAAANLLGVSKLTLRNWDNSGVLKAVRIGNRGDRRYRKKEVEEFLKKTKNPTKEIDKEEFMSYLDKNELWIEEGKCLPLMGDVCIRAMSETSKYFKPGLKFCIFSFEEDYMKQALSIPESIENCETQFKALKKDPEKIKNFVKLCKDNYSATRKAAARTSFVVMRHLSKDQLLKEFDDFNKIIREFWEISLVIEPYNPFLDDVYYPYFEKLVKDPKRAKEAFAILTSPTEPSFITQERRDMLEIIVKYLNTQKEQELILKMPVADYLAEIKFNNPELFRRLFEHQQNYHWIQNSYEQRIVLTIYDFINFIRDNIKEASIGSIKEQLAKINNYEYLINKQNQLIKELKLNADTVKELEFIREVTWLKDERKEVILKILDILFCFLEEFGKRTGIDPKLIGYSSIEEVPAILENNFDLNILQQRRSKSFWISQTGNRISRITGNEAVTLKEKLFPKQEAKKLDELRGNVASIGPDPVVIGKVRVILDPKNQKIENSEILVTSMTRPEFVPIMRKALGVITDEGGITSHAAIISREMNKPCIIGTKFATKILKDGDEVELRMNHGSIRIINQAKE